MSKGHSKHLKTSFTTMIRPRPSGMNTERPDKAFFSVDNVSTFWEIVFSQQPQVFVDFFQSKIGYLSSTNNTKDSRPAVPIVLRVACALTHW